MKKFLLLALAAFLPLVGIRAQTATVSANPTTYDAGGGQITFTVNLTYPAHTVVAGFAAKPPANTWTYVATAGTNVPTETPVSGATTEPADPVSQFGWTYQSGLPVSAASFTFVINYPANLSGNQVVAFAAHVRFGLGEERTDISVPSITLTPTPVAPSITTHPGNVSVNSGANASFTVAASGFPAPTYKWQRSTDGGTTFSDLTDTSPFSGTSTATLTVTGATLAITGNRFRAVASNGTLPNATSTAAILTVSQAPNITTQPANQPVLVGSSASFTVAATGSGTLSYQWYFTPAGSPTPQTLANLAGKISGAQSATLSVSNVQSSDAGDYVCIVSNGVNPAATSNAAMLTIVPRLVQIVSQTAAPGANILVPIQLVASGSENTVTFSLQFDPTKITHVSQTIGGDVTGGTLTPNVTQKDSGKLSYIIGKAPGETYVAGTRTVLNITFAVNAAAADGSSLSLVFVDSPTVRKIFSVTSDVLPGAFLDGDVKVSAGLEGDLNGDGEVDGGDWVKLGRIVVGLDPMPTGASFTRADIAPRPAKGDGTVDGGDWVQLGRYVVGLDAVQTSGGPSTPQP